MNLKNKVGSLLFMAFSSGKSSEKAANEIKRYIGIGAVNILSVNPDRATFNKIFTNSKQTDPINYIGTRDVDGKSVPTARVSFIVKVDGKFNNGVSTIMPINFNLEKRYMRSMDGTKVKVIDEFGRTAWVTKQQLDNHDLPEYTTRLSKNYTPVYRGQENLLKFLRAFLCIDDIDVYNPDTRKFEDNNDPDNCRSVLERIPDYFNGDFSEIREAVALQPDNKVKILFGVRHTDDNKDIQDFFNAFFMKNRQISTKGLERELQSAKNGGAYANTDFDICEIKEYEGPKPTDFSGEIKSMFDDPFNDDMPNFDEKKETVDDLPFG